MPQPTLKAPVGQKFRKKTPKATSISMIGVDGSSSTQSLSNIRKLSTGKSMVSASIAEFSKQIGMLPEVMKADFDAHPVLGFPQFPREFFLECRSTLDALVQEFHATVDPLDLTKIFAQLENDSPAMQRIKEGFHLLYQLDMHLLQAGMVKKASRCTPNTSSCNSTLNWMVTEPMARASRGNYESALQAPTAVVTDASKTMSLSMAVCQLVPYGVTPLVELSIFERHEDSCVDALWCMLAKAANANSYLLQYYMGLSRAEFKAELKYHSMNILTALLVIRPDSELLRGSLVLPQDSVLTIHPFTIANWELWKGYVYLNQIMHTRMEEDSLSFPRQKGDLWFYMTDTSPIFAEGTQFALLSVLSTIIPYMLGLGKMSPIGVLSRMIPTMHTLKAHWENRQEIRLASQQVRKLSEVPCLDMDGHSLALSDMCIKLGTAYHKLYNNRVSVGLYPAKLDAKFEKKNPGALPSNIMVIGVQEGTWTLLPVFFGWDVNYLPTFLIPLHRQTINNLLSVYKVTRATHPPATSLPPKELSNDWLAAHGGFSAQVRNMSLAGLQAFLTSGIAFSAFPRKVDPLISGVMKNLTAKNLVPSNFRVEDIRDYLGAPEEKRKSSQTDLVVAFSLGGELTDNGTTKRGLTILFGAP